MALRTNLLEHCPANIKMILRVIIVFMHVVHSFFLAGHAPLEFFQSYWNVKIVLDSRTLNACII